MFSTSVSSASLRQFASRALEPRFFAPFAAVLFVIFSLHFLHHMAAHASGRAKLVQADAAHYVAISQDIAAGNFTMDYVKRRPHRQPLYPALLAVAEKASGGSLFCMGAVNIVLSTIGFLVLYFGLLRLGHHRFIAAFVGGLYLVNPMLHAVTSKHLMTEPLHILLMLVVIFTLLEWLRTGRAWAFLLLCAAVGLDYLTRPNGLFVMAALLGTLLAADVVNFMLRRPLLAPEGIWGKSFLYAGGLFLFILVTVPSWLPRLEVYGDPIHHGYLSNYMWVDSYAKGHVGQAYATYHLADYTRTHTAADALRRMATGVWEVAFAIPLRTEGTTSILCLFACAGVMLAMVRGPREMRILVLMGAVQLLPLMWTYVANPNHRVPYAATFPFELVIAAFSLTWLTQRAYPKLREHILVPWGEAAADLLVVSRK